MMEAEKGEKRPKYKIERPATIESITNRKDSKDNSTSSLWDVIYNWPDYTQV